MKKRVRFWISIKQAIFIIGLVSLLLGAPRQLRADSIRIYCTPAAQRNSIVFQINGSVLKNWYAISNNYTPPLNRSSITNILQAYFVSQNPTNFELYASLFEFNSRPTNNGAFGAVPNAMWLKGIYQYDNHTICDVRFRYLLNGQEKLHDTLLTMMQTNGYFFLTGDLEEPGICLFEQERNHESVWIGGLLLATNWSGNGYFSVTNQSSQANSSNPWIVWLPGSRLDNITMKSNSPVATNFTKPEDVVISGIRSLINNETNAYLGFVHPDDLNRQSQYYNITPSAYIRTNWHSSRQLVINGMRLSESVTVGDTAYVTFWQLSTNGVSVNKDWLFLRRFGSGWRLSDRNDDEGNAVIYYLFNTCAQFQTLVPKVLPVP